MYSAPTWFVALSALASSVAPVTASLDCKRVVAGGHTFDLSKLGGPHSVVTTRFESSTSVHENTTYTLDICSNLKKGGGKDKGKDQCPNGTRVCAITHTIKGDSDEITKAVAIAGSLQDVGGSRFHSEVVRLKGSESHSDNEKEGVRMILEGGKHPLIGPVKERKTQKAIIEFLCDHDKEGTEGEWLSEDHYDGDGSKNNKRGLRARDDDKESSDDDKDMKKTDDDDEEGDEGESSVEHQLKKDGAALIWDGYKEEKNVDVLRLTWHTKHACERSDGGNDKDGSGDVDGSANWGFFTWFVIICFMGIAAYLIFGSWLNYNRYGARGWDLVPHGDTIRDIPYLLKDWTRRVLNTVQGTGSRGGYSAV